MAKLTRGKKSVEIKDNSNLSDAGMKLGIPIACNAGICGVCKVKIEKGMENLNSKTQEEIDAELEKDERLICQCIIKKGNVVIK